MNLEARKTKKKIKGIQQATTGVSQETSENSANKTIVPATLPQLTPTLVSLLEVIEPEVLYAGYDSSIPDSTWRIMTALNMLGGRQVIAAVKWAKAIPGKVPKMPPSSGTNPRLFQKGVLALHHPGRKACLISLTRF